MDDRTCKDVPSWKPILFGALAGGMGWGIRGQYGHELGAMVPGLLVSLTLILIMCPNITSRHAATAAALGAVAMGIGGSMTYGQTVGLTMSAPYTGNEDAWRLGMLGLSIKGALWIAFAGAFLGIGLGGKRYGPAQMLWCLLALIGAFHIGKALLNSPFDPSHKMLPSLYFSFGWRWQPAATAEQLKPRAECWGGLLFALATLLTYTTKRCNDGLPLRLALWGLLGGAVGFPLGQCVQSFHAWHPELFVHGIWTHLGPHINWWYMMETTFGAIMGATLGLGLWANRKGLHAPAHPDAGEAIPGVLVWSLLAVHVALLIAKDVVGLPLSDRIYDCGIALVLLPVVALMASNNTAYLIIFPVLLMPIACETVMMTVYDGKHLVPAAGWIAYAIVPVIVSLAAARWFMKRAEEGQSGRDFLCGALLFTTWIYFLENWAVFDYPWPWAHWTYRTPNGIIFALCAAGLSALALRSGRCKLKPDATA